MCHRNFCVLLLVDCFVLGIERYATEKGSENSNCQKRRRSRTLLGDVIFSAFANVVGAFSPISERILPQNEREAQSLRVKLSTTFNSSQYKTSNSLKP